jgi:hypothetical protein
MRDVPRCVSGWDAVDAAPLDPLEPVSALGAGIRRSDQ